MPDALHWVFHTPHGEQTEAFVALSRRLADAAGARLTCCTTPAGLVLRADFDDEETGREFWLELHSECLDANLAMELVDDPADAQWQPVDQGVEAPPSPEAAPSPAAPLAKAAGAAGQALVRQRPEISDETLYDILRAGDPELEDNLDETIRWIESSGLPVINLLSYLELPLFVEYARTHPNERDQNLFLHMLHTWTCFRRFGARAARIPPELAEAFTAPRYLRLNTTQFRSPAPALCVQFTPWTLPLRGPGADDATVTQWAKEIYLTHLEPPTPADDRELTLMIVTHDADGEFGFVPLEVPLSLPGVGQSIDAFFAPGESDEMLGANSRDLHKLTTIAATYCLYACARNPTRYLQSGEAG